MWRNFPWNNKPKRGGQKEGKLFGVEALVGCGGDACYMVSTRATNQPSTQVVAVFYCRNTSNKPINVKFKWVNMYGGPGMVLSGRVKAGQEVSWDLREFSIVGHYSNAASYA